MSNLFLSLTIAILVESLGVVGVVASVVSLEAEIPLEAWVSPEAGVTLEAGVSPEVGVTREAGVTVPD